MPLFLRHGHESALYKRYRSYLNLLVRPSRTVKRVWEHHEPGAPERKWHEDWLSRVVPYRYFSIYFSQCGLSGQDLLVRDD